MNYYTGVYWDTGLRALNEDSLLLEKIKTSGGRLLLAVVADGIGGLSEGENASGFIIEKLNKALFREVIPLYSKHKGIKRIERCILKSFYEIHEELSLYAKRKNIKLGSTISYLLIIGRRYIIFHLGDSKVFKIHKKRVYELTKNHSVREGSISKCIGSFAFNNPDILTGYIRKNTAFILASDGFYRSINMGTELFDPDNIIIEEQIENRLCEAGKYIKNHGQEDNASAVYIKCI